MFDSLPPQELTPRIAAKIVAAMAKLATLEGCTQAYDAVHPDQSNAEVRQTEIAYFRNNFEELLALENKPAFNFPDAEWDLMLNAFKREGIAFDRVNFGGSYEPALWGGFHWLDLGELRRLAAQEKGSREL